MKALEGRIAVVAGATRGAGRGIACALGEAGAIVYCTGRSVRGEPPTRGIHKGRAETIEETAEMVSARGGVGIAVRVDHNEEAQVAALFARVRREHKRLDVLVNVLGGDTPAEFKPFWKLSLDKGLRWLREEAGSHIITCRHAAPLMVERRGGLIVELTDGDTLWYRCNLFYDLVKVSTMRLAYGMAEELHRHGVAALSLTPGFLRTEWMLDHFGVTEENWRDGGRKDPNFLASESPLYVGRAVAALAADPRLLEKSGGAYNSWGLAREYGFTDADGSQPDIYQHFAAHSVPLPGSKPRTGLLWTLARLPPADDAAPKRKARGTPAA